MNTTIRILLLLLIMSVQSATFGQAGIVVKIAPPPVKKEVRMKSPGPNHFWVAGYWKWDGKKYVWIDGRWMPSRTGYVWAPGRWKKVRVGWEWVEGQWRKKR